MSLQNGMLTTSDASGTGVTFLTFLTSRPRTGVPVPERMKPNQLLGWKNGSTGMVELFVVSPDGYWIDQAATASGV